LENYPEGGQWSIKICQIHTNATNKYLIVFLFCKYQLLYQFMLQTIKLKYLTTEYDDNIVPIVIYSQLKITKKL